MNWFAAALSNQDGKFVFDGLTPDVYSIRVSLASFVPALRRNISVLAGSENLLKIQLASALSTIELVPALLPRRRADERFLEVGAALLACHPAGSAAACRQTSSSRSAMASLFSETTGLVKLSAGDSDPFSGDPAGSGNGLRAGDFGERIFAGPCKRQCGLRGQRSAVGRFPDHLPPR